MMNLLRKSGWICAVAGTMLWSSVAQAQTPLSIPESDGGFLPWAVAGGIAVMIVVPAFLNPKRSHLN